MLRGGAIFISAARVDRVPDPGKSEWAAAFAEGREVVRDAPGTAEGTPDRAIDVDVEERARNRAPRRGGIPDCAPRLW
jgi:hypothetical protein